MILASTASFITRISVCSLVAGTVAQASQHTSFLPPNNLDQQDNPSMIENITEAEFNAIINGITDLYKDLAKSKGAKLEVNALWSNSTVNASANQMAGSWVINMYGGLARRPEVSKDGFALVVCHELGHHFGGFAFGGSGWAANEGQSDYFATQSCAKRAWGDQKDLNATFRDEVGEYEKNACDDIYKTQPERDLCYRTAAGGLSLGRLLAALGGDTEPDFRTPSTKRVRRTFHSHPEAQCRIDTYLAGATCSKAFDPTIIPGRRHPKGQGSLDAEKLAAKYSCTEQDNMSFGLRPTCWFYSRLQPTSLLGLTAGN